MIPPSRAVLRYLRNLETSTTIPASRHLSQSWACRGGHSKWSNIKHDKAINDANVGKQRQAFGHDIAVAVRASGPDPTSNPRLAMVLEKAKRASVPKTFIETAILRGQGRSTTGAPLETVTVEALVPPVAVILECETDSKNRAMQDLRLILKEFGGSTSPAAYLFERRGRITVRNEGELTEDEILEAAIEAGALDVETGVDGKVLVDTVPEDLVAVEERLRNQEGLRTESYETIWHPKSETMVGDNQASKVARISELYDRLQDYPGIQGVYTNLVSLQAVV